MSQTEEERAILDELATENANLRSRVYRLEKKVKGHVEAWLLIGWTVLIGGLFVFTAPSSAPINPWTNANRCDTLRIMRSIAEANLADEDERTARTDAVRVAVRQALSECKPQDFDPRRR